MTPYPDGMVSETVVKLPRHEAWTWDDLQAIPDEAHHYYQLIEGQILMSPSPSMRHQDVVLSVAILLRSSAPRDLKVVIAPFDFVPEPETSLQPDALVVRRGTTEPNRTVVAPVLVVEVLSPSTRTFDLTAKRALYARFGVPHYWVVDPEVPSIVALALGADGAYVEVGTATGSESLHVAAPFAIELTAADLVVD